MLQQFQKNLPWRSDITWSDLNRKKNSSVKENRKYSIGIVSSNSNSSN